MFPDFPIKEIFLVSSLAKIGDGCWSNGTAGRMFAFTHGQPQFDPNFLYGLLSTARSNFWPQYIYILYICVHIHMYTYMYIHIYKWKQHAGLPFPYFPSKQISPWQLHLSFTHLPVEGIALIKMSLKKTNYGKQFSRPSVGNYLIESLLLINQGVCCKLAAVESATREGVGW